MSENRQINFSVNLDTSQVPRQAEQSTKAIRAELDKQKAAVDKIMSDLLTSGGKLKVPMEDFKAATSAAGAALDKIGEDNQRMLDRLYTRYDQLAAKVKEAWDAGNMQAAIGIQNGQQRSVEFEIQSRERLRKAIIAQWTELESLANKAEQAAAQQQAAAAASDKEKQSAQTLAQKLAELKKRMSELAAAGQQNSKEYRESAAKAKELSKAIQQLNADSKPDAQVRLRTALMNAKQAMAEAADKFGRGSVQFKQARDEAIRLQQAMNSMNKQVKNLSAPNATYQGIINGLSGISGAASAATGAMALFGGESQQTAQAMAKLQAIMSITMGLQSMSMMLNKNSAVQLNIIGRLTEWWAACKAKAAAATTTETAAVITNTGAQSAQTAVVEAGTVANTAHAFSWKAVGIAIKSVPVFGWIITGITALIGVISIFTRKTEEEIEAEKRLQKQQEEHRQRMESYRSSYASTAASLIRNYKELQVAWSQLRTEQEKRKWLDENAKKFKTLGKNAKTVNDAEQFLVNNTDNVVAALKARAMALAAQELQQKEYQKYLERMFEIENTVAGGGYYNVYSKPSKNPTGAFMPQEWSRAGLQHGTDYTSKFEGQVTQEWMITQSGVDKINEYRRQQAIQLRQRNEAEATQAWNKIEKWLDDEIAKQKAIIKKAGLNFDTDTPDAPDKDTPDPNSMAKVIAAMTDAELRALRERNRQIAALALEKEQSLINIEKNGAKKRAAQRALDFRKEEYDLQLQFEDQIQAEINRAKSLHDAQERVNKAQAQVSGKTYTEQAFDAGALQRALATGNITIGMNADDFSIDTGEVDKERIKALLAFYNSMGEILRVSQQRRIEAQTQEEQLALAEYLQEYGTYEEKKTAIAAIYAAKRAKAITDAEQMQLAQEENKALNDVEFDDFMTNRAALAFGEIENLSRSTIARLIEEMERYRDKVTQTFDPDKIEKFNRALSDLKRAQAMSEGGIFSQLFTPAYFKERKAALAEINATEITHNELLDAKARKEEEVRRKIEEIIAKVKELTGQDITADQVTDGSTITGLFGQLGAAGNEQGAADLSGLMSGLNSARVELGQVTNASNKASASLGQLKEAFAGKFTGQGGALAMVDTIVHGINDIVQGANETVKELASTADALGADTSVGSGWDKAQTFMQGFADASAGATEAFESLKSGNIMGVVSGVTKSITSWVKAFAAIHDASRERTIQRRQDEIDELERMNRRIDNRLKGEYSKQANKSYEAEIRNLEKQRKLILQQIAAERDKKNTDDDRIKEWQDKYEELGWQIEEYKDKALDAIIGEDISTSIDNFADKLAECWGKTGDRARAVKDYVKSMLKQMVLEAMKTDLTEPIRRLREMMAKALEDDVVTEREQAELEAFAQQLAQETERKYKWADRIMNDGTASSGSSTVGTFATASQDSITELSGRAAAIHTSGEMRRELLMSISVDMAAIREQAAANADKTEEIRELALLAVSYLESITRNTNELYEINERLEKIEKNTRGL